MRAIRHFTLVELLTIIAILGVLAALLLPSLDRARRTAKKVRCLSNVRQCLVGVFAYASDYAEFPYSWQYGVPHTETMSNHYMQVYAKVPGLWTNVKLSTGPDVYNQHEHMMSEGDGVYPYWEFYLLNWQYVSTPDVLGCGFSAPTGWLVWPSSCTAGAAGVSISDAKQIQRAPPFVYRGPSADDDHRNTVYACGQIAGGGSSDARFGGRSGAWYPHFSRPGKPKPIFHCPVVMDRWPTGYEYYASLHAYPHGIRKRDVAPMSVGWGRYAHYLDETIGWSDGRATLAVQPASSPSAWFVNYNGDVIPTDTSGF